MKRASMKIPAAAMLTHFTRASKSASALDNLVAILRCGAIRGGRRMVGGKRAAVCMFDVPIMELGALLDRGNRRRYEPFGIAIDKRYAFRMGARPVIYLPVNEARAILAETERWRAVTIDLNAATPIDWSFEREWRVLDELKFEPSGSAA